MRDFYPIVVHEIYIFYRRNGLACKAFCVRCNDTCKSSLRGTLVRDNKAGFYRAAK